MRVLIAEARDVAGATHPKLLAAIEALAEATDYMLSASRDDALAGAHAYLQLAGDVVGGMLLVKGGARDPNTDQAASLRFYARTILARAPSRLAEVKLGADALGAFEQ
jgi:3-(methylthio)propanoyl-CoA dehydrogenase